MKRIAVVLALILVLGIVFVPGCAAAQNQGTPGKGLIPSNPTGHSTEQVAVINHHVVFLNTNGAGHTSTKENVVNEHVVS